MYLECSLEFSELELQIDSQTFEFWRRKIMEEESLEGCTQI